MLLQLFEKLNALLARLNSLMPRKFPLAEQKVSGYDYGVPTTYTAKHLGVDWKARYVPLSAPCAGKVISCANGPEGGNTLLFQPSGEKTVIRWLHLDQFKCKPGETVLQGRLLAITGMTGNSQGPHLHEDIWKDGVVTLKYADTLNPHEYYAYGAV